MPAYVLITAAKNEERYIEGTIKSVVSQTILPLRWVIVDDGSRDGTAGIVHRWAAQYPFIRPLTVEGAAERHFGAKAAAFNRGLSLMNDLTWDFIGNVDADVTFEPDYYERVFERFRENPKLGIAGGVIYEHIGRQFLKLPYSRDHVTGAMHLFRNGCFRDVGGYLPLKYGGIESVAEVMARMHGWQVKSFDDIPIRHHRRIGTATRGLLAAAYRKGIMDYSHGTHPLYEMLRCLYRIGYRPVVLDSAFRALGYASGVFRHEKRTVPPEVVKFVRKEQLRKLNIFARLAFRSTTI